MRYPVGILTLTLFLAAGCDRTPPTAADPTSPGTGTLSLNVRASDASQPQSPSATPVAVSGVAQHVQIHVELRHGSSWTPDQAVPASLTRPVGAPAPAPPPTARPDEERSKLWPAAAHWAGAG